MNLLDFLDLHDKSPSQTISPPSLNWKGLLTSHTTLAVKFALRYIPSSEEKVYFFGEEIYDGS
ncbi:hypothetical protein MA16_Dca026672 [Dendrobium catenatum]|uniref:Uncharacterized protein n=1 Tax=Dendrobium catenatum TaxID=906689 RepID=A0A2I0W4B9_9ASPA|nr:hypothetical protein MA16_Dca026672 [Dendrobium catenatum]